MKFILIYTTHKDLAGAQEITSILLNEKLIACANFFPITSSYSWKGTIETTEAIVAILKTRSVNWEKVKEAVLVHHPYETPCVIKFAEVEANESYAAWVHSETDA
jgi:periplasmic divalent cation tolerance protein